MRRRPSVTDISKTAFSLPVGRDDRDAIAWLNSRVEERIRQILSALCPNCICVEHWMWRVRMHECEFVWVDECAAKEKDEWVLCTPQESDPAILDTNRGTHERRMVRSYTAWRV